MKSKSFPYQQFEAFLAWDIMEQAIEELERNKDVIVQTDKRYVIGYILKKLADKGYVK